tara:strand:- start:251 stop:403 length:153 start_codon:yes stop_codon:yes gene_type:complete
LQFFHSIQDAGIIEAVDILKWKKGLYAFLTGILLSFFRKRYRLNLFYLVA